MTRDELTPDGKQLLATMQHFKRMTFTDIMARISRPDRAVGELAGAGFITCVDRKTLTYALTEAGFHVD